MIRNAAADLRAVHWELKGPADFVSAVDRAAEEAIATVVSERHPGAVLMAEELSPKAVSGDLTFVADPLDGTTNFLHGFPWYAVSIAAMSRGTLIAGAVLNASNGDLFTAARGSGARKNGQPIRVSEITDPSRALVGTGFPFKHREGIAPYLKLLPRIIEQVAGSLEFGKEADLLILDVADYREIPYHFGVNHVELVMKKGEVVYREGAVG